MKVMTVSTAAPSLRDEIFGWSLENSDLFVRDKPIGRTPTPLSGPYPNTILEALHDGWKLLGPPTRIKHDDGTESWEWWLTRE